MFFHFCFINFTDLLLYATLSSSGSIFGRRVSRRIFVSHCRTEREVSAVQFQFKLLFTAVLNTWLMTLRHLVNSGTLLERSMNSSRHQLPSLYTGFFESPVHPYQIDGNDTPAHRRLPQRASPILFLAPSLWVWSDLLLCTSTSTIKTQVWAQQFFDNVVHRKYQDPTVMAE